MNHRRCCLVALIAVLLVGCTSSPKSRFYLLSSQGGGVGAPTAVESACVSIGVGPIRLPEYVERPQIVTRTAENEITLGEYDRWAEPLNDTFPRVLAENLSHLVCTKSLLLFPWKPTRPPDYRVEVEVYRFDGTLGKEARLEVWWRLARGAEKGSVVSKRSSISEPLNSTGYDVFVRVQSRLIASLSREIAETIDRIRVAEKK